MLFDRGEDPRDRLARRLSAFLALESLLPVVVILAAPSVAIAAGVGGVVALVIFPAPSLLKLLLRLRTNPIARPLTAGAEGPPTRLTEDPPNTELFEIPPLPVPLLVAGRVRSADTRLADLRSFLTNLRAEPPSLFVVSHRSAGPPAISAMPRLVPRWGEEVGSGGGGMRMFSF